MSMGNWSDTGDRLGGHQVRRTCAGLRCEARNMNEGKHSSHIE